jgi:hypothetical protein
MMWVPALRLFCSTWVTETIAATSLPVGAAPVARAMEVSGAAATVRVGGGRGCSMACEGGAVAVGGAAVARGRRRRRRRR